MSDVRPSALARGILARAINSLPYVLTLYACGPQMPPFHITPGAQVHATQIHNGLASDRVIVQDHQVISGFNGKMRGPAKGSLAKLDITTFSSYLSVLSEIFHTPGF